MRTHRIALLLMLLVLAAAPGCRVVAGAAILVGEAVIDAAFDADDCDASRRNEQGPRHQTRDTIGKPFGKPQTEGAHPDSRKECGPVVPKRKQAPVPQLPTGIEDSGKQLGEREGKRVVNQWKDREHKDGESSLRAPKDPHRTSSRRGEKKPHFERKQVVPGLERGPCHVRAESEPRQ